jgi:hypothetical protein
VHDGIVGSKDGGDWASRGERDPWVQLDWGRPVRADRIMLYDRPGTDDDANAGTLVFSDGSTVDVTGLPVNGSAKTVTFLMRTFDSVRFQVQGGTGQNPGLSEVEVYAVPSAPDPPSDMAVERDGTQATVQWEPPAFDGGAPVTGYVVKAYRDGGAEQTVTVDEDARQAVVTGLSTDASSYAFTVAADNLVGTGSERGEPVLATGIEIVGPQTIREPYGSTRFEAVFTPAETTLKEARWSVAEPDGSPTDKATITADGVLTSNHRRGDVRVTATAADGGGASASTTVALAPDPALLRDNASRWPGVVATASSQFDTGYGPAKVHDGLGAAAGEWASAGEPDPWIQLTWEQPVRADRVVIYDRPGVDDAGGGTLSFSDGSTVQVSDIPSDGGPRSVTFEQRSFAWVRFQVEGGSGPNVGLAEFEVYAVPSAPGVPTEVAATAGAASATVTWGEPVFDGGAPVTSFLVTAYHDGVAMEPLVVDADAGSLVVPGLATGHAYEFTVTATNIMGTGPESERTDPVVPT